ncbi:hypothetical protein VTN00DRAFT_719 [Thermoascus crustaceus]|uniref:uncharacterized protein n=1 Tax=Thermoascus crustaceus TaxID=5088 RepID=UPI0037434F7C
MPLSEYGMWKAKIDNFTWETKKNDPRSPHMSLYFDDNDGDVGRAAINIKSGAKDESRLAYWYVPKLQHRIVSDIQKRNPGFGYHSLTDPRGLSLDYIRASLFESEMGILLEHDITGPNNDIIDSLVPVVQKAKDKNATIYLYGEPFDRGKGIHNVHMNQGNSEDWKRDDGVWQDGGFLLEFKEHWEGVFIGFASQANHTDDKTGHAIAPYTTWASFLDPKLPKGDAIVESLKDRPVLITEALVNPLGPENRPGGKPEAVTLTNRTDQSVALAGWKIQNKAGQSEELPNSASLVAKESKSFGVPSCPLSKKGDVINLFNSQGLKVHGVSYTKRQARREGATICFDTQNLPASATQPATLRA